MTVVTKASSSPLEWMLLLAGHADDLEWCADNWRKSTNLLSEQLVLVVLTGGCSMSKPRGENLADYRDSMLLAYALVSTLIREGDADELIPGWFNLSSKVRASWS